MHSIIPLFQFNTIAKICFEDVERISNAQGIGFHVGCLRIDLVAIIGCVFNLGIKDELPLKPKAPNNYRHMGIRNQPFNNKK